MLLEVQRVSKAFGQLKALQAVTVSVPDVQIVGLIGPNGSGKSTLFDIITGFQQADAGAIRFKGHRIDGLSPHRIANRGLMRTFQFSEGGQRLTTTENLLAAATGQCDLLALANPRALLRRERETLARVRDVLDLLGLRSVANEYLGNLSGGQRKLVDLGRIFIAQPSLALLDEPTAGVSPTLIRVILDALKEMNRAQAISLVIVEHNMEVIFEVSDYVYVLDAGVLIAEGSSNKVQADERVLSSYLGRGYAAEGVTERRAADASA